MFIVPGVIRGGMGLLCRFRGLLLKLKQCGIMEMTGCVESLELIAMNRIIIQHSCPSIGSL